MTERILVVEDEPAILESVAYALRHNGFETEAAPTLELAESLADLADLIILDVMLPDGSGLEFLQRLRADGQRTPIIVLSSRDSESDRIAALEAGADDYVTKPFSPREVVARVRAVLRRVNPAEGEKGCHLRVEPATRRAFAQQSELDLTRVEFDLVSALLGTPGNVYTRSQLIESVWGDGYAITDRTVDSHIKSLRRKISEAGASADTIETVRGVGYRVSPSAPPEPTASK